MPALGTSSERKLRWVEALQNVLQHRKPPQNYLAWRRFFSEPANKDFFPVGETQFPPKSTFYSYLRFVKPGDSLDRPWSIGASVSDDISGQIPVAALPELTALTFRASASGRVLSVRQAIWVARLRNMVRIKVENEGRARMVYGLASKYALREKISAQSPRSNDLDIDTAIQLLTPFVKGTEAADSSRYEGVIAATLLGVNSGLILSPTMGTPPPTEAYIDDEIASDLLYLTHGSKSAATLSEWTSLELWKSTVIMYGLRAQALQTQSWINKSRSARRDDKNMQGICSLIRSAAIREDWSSYRELTGGSAVSNGSHQGR